MPTAPRPRLADTADDHADDRVEIERVIADLEAAMNASDAALAVRHFAADARAVDVRGRSHTGAEALLQAHLDAFAGPLAGQVARYEVADVAFVSPGVALAWKHATAIDAHGTPIDAGHGMVALYVFVRDGGRWWIAARQNTLVPG